MAVRGRKGLDNIEPDGVQGGGRFVLDVEENRAAFGCMPEHLGQCDNAAAGVIARSQQCLEAEVFGPLWPAEQPVEVGIMGADADAVARQPDIGLDRKRAIGKGSRPAFGRVFRIAGTIAAMRDDLHD